MKQLQIRQNLDSIILYLEKYWEFVNCHIVNYFTDDHWNNFMQEEIKNYVKENDIQNIIEDTFWKKESNSSNPVRIFYDTCKTFWLENLNVAINVENFYQTINLIPSVNSLSVKGFMGEKKLHEVEITSNFIVNLIKSFEDENIYIVDAGDGKGYLSSRIALQHHLKVLGIDANQVNSNGAIERNRKLQRVWDGLVERENLIKAGQMPTRRGKKKTQYSIKPTELIKNAQNYKITTKFITPELDFKTIIKEQFELENVENINICLTGLHTCGNLASTSLKVFKEQNSIKKLCNIGCCYHLINEEFCHDAFFVNKDISTKNTDFGFPLSNYLRKQKLKLGRNARMLASQSVHRTFSEKNMPDKSLFYRSLLEKIIVAQKPHLKNLVQVGKIKKISNFQQYFRKCDEKLNLKLSDLREEYLLVMEKQFSNEENKLNLFYLLRMCMAPIIESLILLDRLLFLYEENFDNTFLIKLFDPVVSPRCYAIVSIRE